MRETAPEADAEREFFSAIEAEFIRRRGTPFLLSPKDFALMRRWRDAGIPTGDVLAGIDDAFERRIARGGRTRINSLSYCEGAVLEAWERHAAARVGSASPGEGGEINMEKSVERLREQLKTAGASHGRHKDAILRADQALERLRVKDQPASEIDASLARIEKRLLRDIEKNLTEEETIEIESEFRGRLDAAAPLMETAALRRTIDILRRQMIRDRLGLPRLTLLFS